MLLQPPHLCKAQPCSHIRQHTQNCKGIHPSLAQLMSVQGHSPMHNSLNPLKLPTASWHSHHRAVMHALGPPHGSLCSSALQSSVAALRSKGDYQISWWAQQRPRVWQSRIRLARTAGTSHRAHQCMLRHADASWSSHMHKQAPLREAVVMASMSEKRLLKNVVRL